MENLYVVYFVPSTRRNEGDNLCSSEMVGWSVNSAVKSEQNEFWYLYKASTIIRKFKLQESVLAKD